MAINLLLVLWILSEVLLAFRRRAARVRRRKGRRGSIVLVFVVIVVSIAAANVVLFLVPQRFPGDRAIYTAVAAVLIIAGVGIRWWAILTLGRFFSVDVALQEHHQIVQNGPYRWARHPAYTGLLVIFLGVGIASYSWLSLVLVVAPITSFFLYRISIEEDALSDELGEEYLEYRKKTKRLIPHVY